MTIASIIWIGFYDECLNWNELSPSFQAPPGMPHFWQKDVFENEALPREVLVLGFK